MTWAVEPVASEPVAGSAGSLQITDDANSGIGTDTTYTHAIDFGTSGAATVNGVVFASDVGEAAGGRSNAGTRTYHAADPPVYRRQRQWRPVLKDQAVTYTVSFSEALNATTVGGSDFGNASSSAVTIDSVNATGDPSVFEVFVTPSEAGTLQLQVIAGAVIKDTAGNALNTASAILDNTVITVDAPAPSNTILSSGGGDSWNTGIWSFGVPSGTGDATIAAGIAAQANSSSTPTWSGLLTLESGSSFDVGTTAGSENALNGATRISMDGASILAERGATLSFPAISITNESTITSFGSAAHDDQRLLTGAITGSGGLT